MCYKRAHTHTHMLLLVLLDSMACVAGVKNINRAVKNNLAASLLFLLH